MHDAAEKLGKEPEEGRVCLDQGLTAWAVMGRRAVLEEALRCGS